MYFVVCSRYALSHATLAHNSDSIKYFTMYVRTYIRWTGEFSLEIFKLTYIRMYVCTCMHTFYTRTYGVCAALSVVLAMVNVHVCVLLSPMQKLCTMTWNSG